MINLKKLLFTQFLFLSFYLYGAMNEQQLREAASSGDESASITLCDGLLSGEIKESTEFEALSLFEVLKQDGVNAKYYAIFSLYFGNGLLAQNKEESLNLAFDLAKNKDLEALKKLSLAKLLIGESGNYTNAALQLCNEIAFPHVSGCNADGCQNDAKTLWDIWSACGYKITENVLGVDRQVFEVKSANYREFLACYKEYIDALKTSLNGKSPTCFISRCYTGETEENRENHAQIVLVLYAIGLKPIFDMNGDKNGLALGADILRFMRCGIQNSDYVLMLLTPSYKSRVEQEGFSGVGIEYSHIMNRIRNARKDDCFLLPFVISGDYVSALPAEMQNKVMAESCVSDRGEFQANDFLVSFFETAKSRIFPQESSPIIETLRKKIIKKIRATYAADIPQDFDFSQLAPDPLAFPEIEEVGVNIYEKPLPLTRENSFLFSVILFQFFEHRGGKESQTGSAGTGFLWKHKGTCYLLTNKHVVGLEYQDHARKIPFKEGRTQLSLRLSDDGKTIGGSLNIKLHTNRWQLHEDDSVDLCYLNFDALLKEIEKKDEKRKILNHPLNKDFDAFKRGVRYPIQRLLGSGFEFYMLGFPKGFTGPYETPLFRKGVFASDPTLSDDILLDAEALGGSSGSPVIFRERVWMEEPTAGESSAVRNDDYLVGIVYAGKQHDVESVFDAHRTTIRIPAGIGKALSSKYFFEMIDEGKQKISERVAHHLV